MTNLIEAFKVLPRHIAISLAAFSAFLLTFCATRNAFYLRFIPCLVVAEIGRVVCNLGNISPRYPGSDVSKGSVPSDCRASKDGGVQDQARDRMATAADRGTISGRDP
mmetsp:Transcript_5503/g.9356  ORF Transcript_5503/g.9356 Transcript_5503/m.9356 type:complete len:108 (+) Transcript_5503:229-552(+)